MATVLFACSFFLATTTVADNCLVVDERREDSDPALVVLVLATGWNHKDGSRSIYSVSSSWAYMSAEDRAVLLT